VNYGFFDQDGDPKFFIFSQKKNGKYVQDNDKDLWNAFTRNLYSPASTP